MRVNTGEPGAQLEEENKEQVLTVGVIQDSCMRLLECQYLIKLKWSLNKESSWEPITHLGNIMEFVEKFNLANSAKPNQATIERALQEAAKKETTRKANAETVH